VKLRLTTFFIKEFYDDDDDDDDDAIWHHTALCYLTCHPAEVTFFTPASYSWYLI